MEAVAVVVDKIPTLKLKPNLAFVLTLSISIPLFFQTPDFGKVLLNLRRRITYNLNAVAEMIREISTHKLNSNLPLF